MMLWGNFILYPKSWLTNETVHVYCKRIKFGEAFFLAPKYAFIHLDKIVRTVNQTYSIDIRPICIILSPPKNLKFR